MTPGSMEILDFKSSRVEEKVRGILKDLPGAEGFLVQEGRRRRVTALGALQVKKLRFHTSDFVSEDLEDLRFLGNLQHLEIFSFGVQNFDVFPGLPALKTLVLRLKDQPWNLDLLSKCPVLQTLDAEGLWVQDPAPLASLGKLKNLNLRNSRIRRWDWLPGLKNLTVLDLAQNELQDLGFLAGLTKLKTLYLGGNRIQTLEPLGTLKDLETLGLTDNLVESLEPLAELSRLKALKILHNPLKDPRVLNSLESLETISLDWNPAWVPVLDRFEPGEPYETSLGAGKGMKKLGVDFRRKGL